MTDLLTTFRRRLRARDRRLWDSLSSPEKIQAALERIPYVGEARYRSPATFLRERAGHCFDGAVFAGLALRRLGYPSILLDLLPNERDDDHVLAIYRRAGRWGAIAKSNYTGIRFRAPVYHTVRELAMSYFDGFFNFYGERTMRAMTRPLNLARFDRTGWPWEDAALDRIGDALEDAPVTVLIPAGIARRLPRVDGRCRKAGELGANLREVYRPPRGG